MQRYLRQVDAVTGEVLDGGTLVYCPPRAKIREGWFMGFQDGFLSLAALQLTGREWRVLAYLLGKLDFENYLHVSQADIARQLVIAPPDVSKAVRRLVEAGVLIRGPKVGRAGTLRLAPEFGWKGRVRSLHVARGKALSVVQGGKGSADGEVA